MPIYEYKGQQYDLSETDPAAAKAKIQAYLNETPVVKQTPVAETKPAGVLEQMFGAGSPLASAASGYIVKPLMGLNQMLAETGVFGETVKQQARGNVRALEEARAEGKKRVGREGIDFVEIGASLLSPINKLAPAAAAPTALGRVGQAAGTGVLFGGLEPVKDVDNYLEEKLSQMTTGAIAGTVIGGGLEAGKKAAGVLKKLAQPLTTEGKKQALREYLQKLTGDEKQKVVDSLRKSEEIVAGSKPTTMEAISEVPEAAALAAYQQKLAKTPEVAGRFAAREAEQQAARMKELGTIAGAPGSLQAAQAERAALTAPMREQALEQANIAGQIAPRLEADIAAKQASKARALQTEGILGTEAAQQNVLAQTFTPVPGYPRFPARYTENIERIAGNLEGAKAAGDIVKQRQAEVDFKKFQLKSLEDNGFYPLQTQPIIEKIDSILATPGEGASTVVRNVMTSIKGKLAELTDPKTGVIDSRNLYTVRKEIGNDIQKFSKEAANWDAKLTSGLETNLKGYIDNAIESAGGADWKKYLNTYAKSSEKINRIQIGEELQAKLGTALGNKERAGVFATAVQDAAKTIKRSTGQPRFQNLEEILTKEEITSVNKVLADVQRKAKGEELATFSFVGKADAGGELPNLLNKYASVTNFVLKALKRDSTEEINRIAADLMLNPNKLAAFIEGVPAGQVNNVVSAMMKKLTPSNRELLVRYLTPAQSEAALAREALGTLGRTQAIEGVISAGNQE